MKDFGSWQKTIDGKETTAQKASARSHVKKYISNLFLGSCSNERDC